MDYDKEFKEHVKNANLNNKEQILGLSKPPYFTLCKNPFSNDIINKWESEKSNEVNRAPVTEPFASDISEGKKQSYIQRSLLSHKGSSPCNNEVYLTLHQSWRYNI